MTSIKDAALAYAALGFRVLALYSVDERGCLCRSAKCVSPGKHPLYKYSPQGVHSATSDAGIIETWQEPFNIGIATGGEHGTYVFDVDAPEISATLVDWPNNTLADETGLVATGRGCHVWLRSAPALHGFKVRDQSGKDLGSIQGENQYCAVPPSIHASGRQYTWIGMPSDQIVPVLERVDDVESYARTLLATVGVTMGTVAVLDNTDFPSEALQSSPLPELLAKSGRLTLVLQVLSGTLDLTGERDRSGKLYKTALDIVKVAKEIDCPLSTRALAAVIKRCDELAYHCFTDRRNDDEYWRIAYKALPQDLGDPAPDTDMAALPPPDGSETGEIDEIDFLLPDSGGAISTPAPILANSKYRWDPNDGILYSTAGRGSEICNFMPEILEDIESGDPPDTKRALRVRFTTKERIYETVFRSNDMRAPQAFEKAIMDAIGPDLIIFKDGQKHLKPAMQLFSTNIIKRKAAASSGWYIESETAPLIYLLPTAESGIGADGMVPDVKIDPEELEHGHPLGAKSLRPYGTGVRMPTEDERDAAFDAFRQLVLCGPPEITMPIVLQVLAGPLSSGGIGESPPLLHVRGRTGSLKTTYCMAAISLFGKFTRGATPPASWTSTSNALNTFLAVCKDLTVLFDDYKHSTVGKNNDSNVIQTYADRSGRSRLSNDQTMREQHASRAILLSTGEDTWEQEASMSARTVEILLTNTQIDIQRMTAVQDLIEDEVLPLFGGWYISWLARHPEFVTGDEISQLRRSWEAKIRARFNGHQRVLAIISSLMIVADVLRRFVVDECPEHLPEVKEWLNAAARGLFAATERGMVYVQEQSAFAQLAGALAGAYAAREVCILPRGGITDTTPRLPIGIDPKVPVIGYYEVARTAMDRKIGESVAGFDLAPDDVIVYLTKQSTHTWFSRRQRSTGGGEISWNSFVQECVEYSSGAKFKGERMGVDDDGSAVAQRYAPQLYGVVLPLAAIFAAPTGESDEPTALSEMDAAK